MRLRIAIADDHQLFLEGLVGLLSRDHEIVGTAPDGRLLIKLCREKKPDLALMDLNMPEPNGIQACRILTAEMPDLRVILLTQQLSSLAVKNAFSSGVRGYVAKQDASTELLDAITAVTSGRYYLTKLAQLDKIQGPILSANPNELIRVPLTPREVEVLRWIAAGKSMKEIGAILDISTKTVEFHKNGIIDELGLRTTAELTRYALEAGIAL